MKIQSNPDFLGKIDPEDPQLKDFLTEVEEEYGNARYIDRADKFDNDDAIFVDLDLENPKIQARINMLKQRVLGMLNLQNGSFQYWCEYHSVIEHGRQLFLEFTRREPWRSCGYVRRC